jgi:hypothetical protein
MPKTVLNQQLTKIALAAGGSHYPDVNPAQLQRYSQLLIEECIAVAYRQGDDVAYLKQHFGVE